MVGGNVDVDAKRQNMRIGNSKSTVSNSFSGANSKEHLFRPSFPEGLAIFIIRYKA